MDREQAIDAAYCREWVIRVGDRFKEGDRVVFSHWADRNGVSKGRKGGVRKGIVVEAVKRDGLTIVVLLDGYKTPRKFHHMFFIPAREAGQ